MRLVKVGFALLALGATIGGLPFSASAAGALRLQGSVEPVRSHPVIVPRLAGTGNGTLVIVHLAKPGSRVKRGDLLIEFDRQAQIKTAHDRQASTAISSSRSPQAGRAAHRRRARRGGAEDGGQRRQERRARGAEDRGVPPITAEQNRLSLDERGRRPRRSGARSSCGGSSMPPTSARSRSSATGR